METCATCGAKFTPTGWNHRYCSPGCRPCVLPAAPVHLKCGTCKKRFARTSAAQRYCKPACRLSESPAYKRRRYIEKVGRPLMRRGAPPDLAKRAKVKALRDAGLTMARIAAEMGVTVQAVSLMLAKLKGESPR